MIRCRWRCWFSDFRMFFCYAGHTDSFSQLWTVDRHFTKMRPRSTVAQKKEFSNLIIKFNMSRPINKFQKKKKKWGNLARSQAEWLRLTRSSSSIKTGDEVDLKRRAVRVIEALPGGRLVKIEGEVVLGPVGGKLLVCAAFDEVCCCYHHNKPTKKEKIWIKNLRLINDPLKSFSSIGLWRRCQKESHAI